MDGVVVKESAIVLVQGELLAFDVKNPGIFIPDNNKFIIEAKTCYPGENKVMATPRDRKPTQIRAGEKIGMIIPFSVLFPVENSPVPQTTFTPPPAVVEQEIAEAVTPSVEATPVPAAEEVKPVVRKDWRSRPRKPR